MVPPVIFKLYVRLALLYNRTHGEHNMSVLLKFHSILRWDGYRAVFSKVWIVVYVGNTEVSSILFRNWKYLHANPLCGTLAGALVDPHCWHVHACQVRARLHERERFH